MSWGKNRSRDILWAPPGRKASRCHAGRTESPRTAELWSVFPIKILQSVQNSALAINALTLPAFRTDRNINITFT